VTIRLILVVLDVLRITWSPKICVFERKENLKMLRDKRFDMYERVVTYEGEEFHTRMRNLFFLYPVSPCQREQHPVAPPNSSQ